MSDYFDMQEASREQDTIRREHASIGDQYEIDSIDFAGGLAVAAVVIAFVIAGLVLA